MRRFSIPLTKDKNCFSDDCLEKELSTDLDNSKNTSTVTLLSDIDHLELLFKEMKEACNYGIILLQSIKNNSDRTTNSVRLKEMIKELYEFVEMVAE